jgi:hypothetical protein
MGCSDLENAENFNAAVMRPGILIAFGEDRRNPLGPRRSTDVPSI